MVMTSMRFGLPRFFGFHQGLQVGVLLWCGLASYALQAQSSEDLSQQARSILSNRCFACHGPDEAKIEAGLRLDDNSKSQLPLPSGNRAIVPGKPEASELLNRIVAKDESERMPPPQFGSRLTEQEIAILRRWIEEGARIPKHWAFVKPQRPSLPEGESHHPIDRFVRSILQQKGMTHAPEADRATLLRRLTMDLTGLPPTLEELDAFWGSTSPQAYEEQVDRLLASSAFGEHWGRKWLDLARYADSAGYADDPARTIWAYRDWVLRALNRDQPYDEFTIEQIAGDLLPNPTQEQLIATAFHRNTLTNNEGGTNDEEFRNVAIVDRVNTTMAVWMGLTMACAQCHSHKYDPISQKEYFQVFSILNQTQDADKRDESPILDLYTDEQVRMRSQWESRAASLQQELEKPNPELQEEQLRWEARMGSEVAWNAMQPIGMEPTSGNAEWQGTMVEWNTDQDRATLRLDFPMPPNASKVTALRIETVPDPSGPGGGAGLGNGNFVLSQVRGLVLDSEQKQTMGRYVRIELPGDAKILSLAEVEVLGQGQNWARQGKATQSSTDYQGDAPRAIDGNVSGKYTDQSTTHTASSKDPWWEVDLLENRSVEQIVVHNRTDDSVFSRLSGAKILVLDANRNELWSGAIEKATKKPEKQTVRDQPVWKWTAATADYEQEGFAAAGVLDQNADTGWAVGGSLDRPHSLTLVRDSSTPESASNRQSLSIENEGKPSQKLRLELQFESKHAKHILRRFRVAWTDDPHMQERSEVAAPWLALVLKKRSDRTEEDAQKLAVYYQRDRSPRYAAMRKEWKDLTKRIADQKPSTSVPIQKELDAAQRRKTFVHVRGNYRVQGEVVEAGVPMAFHPLVAPTDRPLHRLDLAHWLVHEDNPLTARVVANRLWESLFGLGLVRTSEEFGSQGDRPSHPALLDWLATEMMRQKWSVKGMLRLICTSDTYRQQSHFQGSGSDVDIDNVWLARGPRVRLSAEQVRDQALVTADLLSHRMYGEPVRPRQPALGLKAAFGSATDWETSEGENRYRRGLYTVWRRSNPYPSMATFDAPNREVCTLKRDRTNTPLQALVTLNDPVFVEAAQGLARRMLLQDGSKLSESERIGLAFRIVTSRSPQVKEVAILEEMLNQARLRFAEDAAAARRMAFDPIGALSDEQLQSVTLADLAAWTTLSNVLLNLDEVLMTR
ncbi:MAG: DUF1553 domain-containing protein [Pirellulales bacterium]